MTPGGAENPAPRGPPTGRGSIALNAAYLEEKSWIGEMAEIRRFPLEKARGAAKLQETLPDAAKRRAADLFERRRCLVCEGPIEDSGRGKPAITCSPRCKAIRDESKRLKRTASVRRARMISQQRVRLAGADGRKTD
jgi:hypothetical protein